MPVYEYEIIHAETGASLATLSLALPMASRDAVSLRRCEVPRSVAIAGTARDPAQPQHQVLNAYQRLERRIGSNAEFQRRIGHTPEQIKRAWRA